MIEFNYSKRKNFAKYSIPEKYNELTGKQLISMGKIFLSGMSLPLAELEALRIMLNMSRFKFHFLSIEAKYGMLQHIQWIFDKNTLTENLIPEYRNSFLEPKFIGPASEWDNLTMAEWSACEVYYEWMVNNHHEKAIDYLISVLYRIEKSNYDKQRDPDGDVRVPYNHHETAYWAKMISKWPVEVKMSILTWYDGCREFMISNYDVFESGTSENDKKAPGMFELIRGLCGNRYGGFEAVEKMNVHKALREMEILKEEAEKLKASNNGGI